MQAAILIPRIIVIAHWALKKACQPPPVVSTDAQGSTSATPTTSFGLRRKRCVLWVQVSTSLLLASLTHSALHSRISSLSNFCNESSSSPKRFQATMAPPFDCSIYATAVSATSGDSRFKFSYQGSIRWLGRICVLCIEHGYYISPKPTCAETGLFGQRRPVGMPFPRFESYLLAYFDILASLR